MSKKLCFLISLMFIAAVGFGQAPSWLWAKSAGGYDADYAFSVAADAAGNAYVSGVFFSSSLPFGSTTLTNSGSSDIFLTKYDANGNVLWARRAGGWDAEYANSVTVDASGNSYVTGGFDSPTINFGSTTLINSNAGRSDIFLAKYDANGNVLWAKRAGGTAMNGDMAYSVKTDALGNAYLAGCFYSSSITFGSTILTNADNTGNSCDLFIAKYDANGNVLWAKNAIGMGNDFSNSVTTDPYGNIYLAGGFNGIAISFGSTTLTNSDNTGNTYDFFLAKYDANGNVLWAKSVGGTSNEKVFSIAGDASGNIFITGWFVSDTLAIGSTTLTNSGSSDIFLAKYNSNGNVIWAKSAGGSSSDNAESIAVDVSGNAYIVGSFYSPILIFDSIILTKAAMYDIFFAKYDADGNVQWAKQVGANGDDHAHSVSINNTGSIYVTGSFDSNSITFDSVALSNVGYGDVFLAKLGIGTGINELSNSLYISIFPNPSTNEITIETPEKATIEILNIEGQILKTITTAEKQTTIDVSNLSGGVYIIKAKTERGVAVKKFIKE